MCAIKVVCLCHWIPSQGVAVHYTDNDKFSVVVVLSVFHDVAGNCVLQIVFVMPSSSARCSQLPRAIDKVPFYVALKKLRDYVRGELVYLDESEVTFPDLDLKIEAKDEQLSNS